MTGSLQIKNDIFYVVLNTKDENGKRKQKWISSNLRVRGNKKAAEAFKRKIIAEYESNEGGNQTENILFVDFIEKWLQAHKSQVDIITWQGYNNIVQSQIIPYFEPLHLDINNVSYNHIQDYYNEKFANGRCDGKGGLSARSVKLHGVILNMVLKDAVEKEVIISSPASRAKLPAQDKSFKGTFYNIAQANVLLEKCAGELISPIVYLTLTYGMRRSEVLGLKWDAVDFHNEMVSVKRTVVEYSTIEAKETTKNRSSRRSYPMTSEILDILMKRKEEQETYRRLFGKDYIENGYVFTWQDGNMIRPDYVSRKLRQIIKRAGLPPLRFHDLRHTTASILLSKGWTLKDIQEWLGHSDIGVTADIYTHIDISRKQSLAESLSNTFVCDNE
jgi:integrase